MKGKSFWVFDNHMETVINGPFSSSANVNLEMLMEVAQKGYTIISIQPKDARKKMTRSIAEKLVRSWEDAQEFGVYFEFLRLEKS
jgi:hypothetical protein